MKTTPRSTGTARRFGSRRGSRGMTIIEMMVGITIGMLVVAAMSMLFANNSRSRLETERAGIKIENGRYALDVLASDLQHAGFLAEFDPRLLTLPATKPDGCETDVAALRDALALPVIGYDNVTAAMLAGTALDCLTDVVEGTDIVVVRRAATCVEGSAGCTALVLGAPTFQASSCNSAAELGGIVIANYYKFADFPSAATFNLTKRDCLTAADLHRYVVQIYYVAQNDQAGDGIPSLKRRDLLTTGAGTWSTTTLAQGIENLQVEWGLDTNNDGTPDLYATDPDKYCATLGTPIPAGTCWTLPVASKTFVLARNIEASPGHDDTKTYALGRLGDATTGISGTVDFSVDPANNNFKRNTYQRLVALQNVTSRRFSP